MLPLQPELTEPRFVRNNQTTVDCFSILKHFSQLYFPAYHRLPSVSSANAAASCSLTWSQAAAKVRTKAG